MSTRSARLLLGLALALSACDEPRHEVGLVVRPGDCLFDRLDELVVRDHPGTSLPAALAERVRTAGSAPSWSLPAEAWKRRGDQGVGPGQRLFADSLVRSFGALFGGSQGLELWHASPPVLLDPALAPWWVERGGEDAQGATGQHFDSVSGASQQTWADESGELILWWDLQRQELVALGRGPPGALRLGCEPARSELGRVERLLIEGAPPPERAAALRERRTLQREDRPCLAAPALTRLVVPIAELGADQLEVVVGVPAARFALARDYVRRQPPAPQHLTFAVEWVVRGQTQRLWTRRVSVDEGWVADVVDLSAWRGRAGTLVLRSLREGDESSHAYGYWSGLRFRDAARGVPERPHLVLVDVDTLRADRLGCYGAERPTSPKLDAWAAREAVVYSDATATGNWTLPSTVSLLTGLEVEQHGVRDERSALSTSVPSLASRLRAAGYETWASTDGGYVVPGYGMAQGFDRFVYRFVPRSERSAEHWSAAREWLARRSGARPVFLFLQTYQVHTPLLRDRRFDERAQPYAGRLDQPQLTDDLLIAAASERALDAREQAWVQALYDAGVRRMDTGLGSFLDALPELFGDEPYVLVFTSDHGEELYDRGRFGHRRSLHTELLHVPLIVRHPRGDVVGRVDAPTTLLDIAATLLDAAGLEPVDELPGRSLLGPLPERRLRVADDRGLAVALQYDGRKLVLPRGDPAVPSELFDRRSDPDERSDLLDIDPRTAERLAELWLLHQQRFPAQAGVEQAEALDADQRADMQALGYVGDR